MTQNKYDEVNDLIKKTYTVIKRSKSKAGDEDVPFMSTKGKEEVEPTVKFKTIQEEILKDEEVRGFYSYIVDAIIQSGYRLEGPTAAKDQELLGKLKWEKIRKGVYFKGLTEKHAFLELIPNAERTGIVKLKFQPSYSMVPLKDERGELKGWVKHDVNGKDVPFELDEISHLSVEDFDGRFWNTPDLVTLERLIKLKQYIIEHITRKFEMNEFRVHFHLQNSNPDEVESILDNMRVVATERDKYLVTAGQDPLKGYKLDTEDSILPLIDLLNKVRNLVLTLIRVPPIIAGTVDNSNRSNSDTQANFVFVMRVKSFLLDLEDEINNELFPKLGIESKLKHNTVSLREDKQWMDMANQLIAMGASKDKTVDWLIENGVNIKADMFIPSAREKAEQDVMKDLGVDQAMPFAKNSDLYPSRKPQKKDTADYKSGEEASTKTD